MSADKQVPLLQVFLNTVAKMKEKIGLARQLMVDTESWRLYLHDGVTKGGHPLRKFDDPTEDIRAIPFKGADPVAGETWVMGEWPSDDDPQINKRAYVAGVVGISPKKLSDLEISEGSDEEFGLVNSKQLSKLGFDSSKRTVMFSGSSYSLDVSGYPDGFYLIKAYEGHTHFVYLKHGATTFGPKISTSQSFVFINAAGNLKIMSYPGYDSKNFTKVERLG